MTTHGYTGSGSPNRADAMIWLISELFPGIVKKRDEDEKKKADDEHDGYGSTTGSQQGWMRA
jgi:hypothetical protein